MNVYYLKDQRAQFPCCVVSAQLISELKPETSAPLHRHMRKTNQTGQPYYLNVYEVEMYESDY